MSIVHVLVLRKIGVHDIFWIKGQCKIISKKFEFPGAWPKMQLRSARSQKFAGQGHFRLKWSILHVLPDQKPTCQIQHKLQTKNIESILERGFCFVSIITNLPDFQFIAVFLNGGWAVLDTLGLLIDWFIHLKNWS